MRSLDEIQADIGDLRTRGWPYPNSQNTAMGRLVQDAAALADNDGTLWEKVPQALAHLGARVEQLEKELNDWPVIIESLCTWRDTHRQSHGEFHLGNECPYHVIAEVMRGHADPRITEPALAERAGRLVAELLDVPPEQTYTAAAILTMLNVS